MNTTPENYVPVYVRFTDLYDGSELDTLAVLLANCYGASDWCWPTDDRGQDYPTSAEVKTVLESLMRMSRMGTDPDTENRATSQMRGLRMFYRGEGRYELHIHETLDTQMAEWFPLNELPKGGVQ